MDHHETECQRKHVYGSESSVSVARQQQGENTVVPRFTHTMVVSLKDTCQTGESRSLS